MLLGGGERRSRVMRRNAVSAMSLSSARRAESMYASNGRVMDTATLPAMIAVIEITMTISTKVAPCAARSGQGVRRIADSVAVQDHGGVRGPDDGNGDEQPIGGGNGAQRLVGDRDAGAVGTEVRKHCPRQIGDARSDAETVVVADVVERRRAGARFPSLRAERQLVLVVRAARAAGAAGGR